MMDIKLVEFLALLVFSGAFAGMLIKISEPTVARLDSLAAESVMVADSVKIHTPDFIIEPEQAE